VGLGAAVVLAGIALPPPPGSAPPAAAASSIDIPPAPPTPGIGCQAPGPRLPTGRPARPSAGAPPPSRHLDPRLATGVDVGHGDGRVAFDRVRDAGGAFAIVRATEGEDGSDPAFERNIRAARAAGLVVGASHRFDHGAPGVTQAEHFADAILAADAVDHALPPAIVVACFPPFGDAHHALARARLRAMVDRLTERTGVAPMIHTSRPMWLAVTGGDRGFGDLPLWVVCWRCVRPLLPAGWADFAVWQTGSRQVPGIPRRLAWDVFAGTVADLERWVGLRDWRERQDRATSVSREEGSLRDL
jgi:lysozyme